MLPLLGLSMGLRGWIIAGLAAALLLLGGVAAWKDSQLRARERLLGRVVAERDQAIAIAQANADALAEAQRMQRHAEAAAVQLLDRRQASGAKIKTIIKEVYRDPAPQLPAGCPAVSPVLRDGLERLRSLRAGEGDPGRPAANGPGSRALAELRR